MRAALALFALTGCSQVFGLSDPVLGSPADAAVGDARRADSMDGQTSTLASCDSADSTLLVCFDFEGSIVDLSSNSVPVSSTNVAYVPGVHGMAVYMGAASTATMAGSSLFNVSSVTIETWIKIEALPVAGARAGVFDSDSRYSLFIHADGSMASRNMTTQAGLITPGEWTHVAMAEDGTTLRFYHNAVLVSQLQSSVTSSNLTSQIGGNAPTGDRFIGAMDSLRVYRAVRSQQQICAAANTAEGC